MDLTLKYKLALFYDYVYVGDIVQEANYIAKIKIGNWNGIFNCLGKILFPLKTITLWSFWRLNPTPPPSPQMKKKKKKIHHPLFV